MGDDVKLKLIQKIAKFADKYYEEHLGNIRVDELKNDWWEALKFFFSKAFYQGRRDEISYRVQKAAEEVLGYYFNNPQTKDQNFDLLKRQNWKQLIDKLKEKIGKGKVGRKRDIEMIKSTLDFISRIPDKNIVNYSVKKIKNGELKSLWKELLKIYSVGEKVASFYLRDLVALLHLESDIHDGLEYLQPIDTWVRKMCKICKIEGENDKELREKIVQICKKSNISPIKFNMGAWYVATHALFILINLLEQDVGGIYE